MGYGKQEGEKVLKHLLNLKNEISSIMNSTIRILNWKGIEKTRNNCGISLDLDKGSATPDLQGILQRRCVSEYSHLLGPLLEILKQATIATSNQDIDVNGDDGNGDNGGNEEIVEIASFLISTLTLHSWRGQLERNWIFTSNGVSDTMARELQVSISEPDFVNGGLGWKTWGSGSLLARLIFNLPHLFHHSTSSTSSTSVTEISSPTSTPTKISSRIKCIELGSGTGLAGIIFAKVFEDSLEETVLTDYNHTMLQTALWNSISSSCLNIRTSHLDWFTFPTCTPDVRDRFEVVIAADMIYSREHAIQIPLVVDCVLGYSEDCRFHCVFPLRPQFKDDVELFWSEMLCRFKLVRSIELLQSELGQDDIDNDDYKEDGEDEMCRVKVWYRFATFKRR